jgi:MerR family transcriptional regulator, light-induced transcriptional regulator
MVNGFTIKDLENLSGIKAHTIRIWEQRYSFLKPQRTDTNIRYYTSDELKNVLNIAILNKYGFKISHIDKMNPEQIREKIIAINNASAQQERIINDMIQCMVDMDIEGFEEVMNNYIKTKGIDKTITHIIFPFLERIGILWLTNHINPAQEHLVTNIIRQKLIVGIENVYSLVNIDKQVLFFLPEGEHHELGLLYTYYLMKSRGIKTIYLGANVPVKDVEFVAGLKKPDLIYCHLTSVAHNFNIERFLNQLNLKLPNQVVIISGLVVQQYKKKLPANVQVKTSLQDVMEFISNLH